MASTIRSHRFPNGFRLVYQKSEQSIPLTSIRVFCDVGSAYEQDGIRGASHFVEHMCFKGTEQIHKTRDLLVQYNQMGARFNAYTDKRVTFYSIDCEDTFVEPSTHIVADMLLHSTFPRKEFIKEQHVVIEENIRGEDNHSSVLQDKMEAIFFKGSSYAYEIDNIRYHPTPTYLKEKDMFQWYKWFYQPSNMIWSIVTNLPFSTIVAILKRSEMAKKEQEHEPPRLALSTPILTLHPISPTDSICIECIPKKGLSTTILQVGFRTCSRDSPDRHKLNLLHMVLNGFSGILFTAFRTQQGLTYRTSCETSYYEHTGYISIFIQTDPQKMFRNGSHDGVLPTLIRILIDLKQKGVDQDEVNIAKSKLKGSMLRDRESIHNIATYNGYESIYNKEDTIIPYQEQYSAYYQRITKKQIDAAIQKYFCRENMVVGIMQEKEFQKKKIHDICYQFH